MSVNSQQVIVTSSMRTSVIVPSNGLAVDGCLTLLRTAVILTRHDHFPFALDRLAMTSACTRSRFVAAPACVLVLIFAPLAIAQQAVEADVLLAGGTIYDGSGADGVVGDVAIRDGKVVAVGKFARGT